jgi:hypothetical protein
MGFLTPAYFWLTSFLAVLIVFYLFRKQFTKQQISSTLLWDQLIQEWKANRWWRKLQRHLLLLLQILIVCFLILALAQPFFSGKGINGAHIVVVIDTSATMQANEDGSTRFEKAKTEVLKIIDSLGSEQQMSLLTAGKVPQLIFTNESEKQRMKNEVNELIPSLQEDSIVQAAGYASSLVPEGDGEIHLYTDSLAQEEIEEMPFSNKVVVHNIGKQRNNLSLKSFGVAKTEGMITGVVTVANESKEDQTVTVEIEGGEGTVKKRFEVKAEATELMFVEGLGQADYYEAVLANEDAFAADNQISAFLGGQAGATVYLAGKTNPFLEKALPLLGFDPVVLSADEQGEWDYPEEENPLYILSGIQQEKWPNGPKLILSPAEGGTFNVKPKVEAGEELESSSSSPLLRYVDMNQVFLQSRFPYETENLETIVSSGEAPVISKGSFGGSPLVLAGFDLQDSDWPLQPGFPIFIKNAMEYLQQENQSLGYAEPDEQMPITFSADAKRAEIIDVTNEETVIDLPIDLEMVAAPGNPGVYQVKETISSGTRYRYLAVLLPEKEQSIIPESSFTLGGSNEEKQENQSIHLLWKWAALFAFILLIVEWEVYRRGISA